LDLVAEEEARNACKHEGRRQEPITLELARARLETFFLREEKRIISRDKQNQAIDRWLMYRRLLAPREFQLQRLAAFKEPPIDCYDSDDIKKALAQASWSHERYRAGVSFTVDTFALVFGFNPKPSEALTKGEGSRVEGRIDGARAAGGLEMHVGAGVGRSRDALSDPYQLYVAPSLSFAITVASLSADPLTVNGKLNTLDGKLPPRLVVGVDGEVQYVFDPPTEQATHFSTVKATLFADFLFTDALGFRLGVPLRGKVVKREADTTAVPPVAAERDLQWSIPVFFTSVLKM
jgi:hypothetical protein